MEESTASKVVISTDSSDPLMASHINPAQLEVKFGGTAPNRKSFW